MEITTIREDSKKEFYKGIKNLDKNFKILKIMITLALQK